MAMKHGALRHIISGGESIETAITTRPDGGRPVSAEPPDLAANGVGEPDEDDLEATAPARLARRAFSDDQLRTIEEGVRLILKGLGEDLNREGIRNTPARVARMYADLCSGHSFNATTFPNTQGYSEMVLVRGIQFYSLCEHHLMPFFGTVTVAYIPGDRFLGLSKLGRIVEQYA
ncbi:MAG: GTP cyclohydrolase I, partial [Chloroflexi bacterium]|nr:GTP cyclohydrolase I [Chloroflexota bacterium]